MQLLYLSPWQRIVFPPCLCRGYCKQSWANAPLVMWLSRFLPTSVYQISVDTTKCLHSKVCKLLHPLVVIRFLLWSRFFFIFTCERCLGYSAEKYQLGSCADQDPCDHGLCPMGTKCVPQKHICLPSGTNDTNCQQYTCGTSINNYL